MPWASFSMLDGPGGTQVSLTRFLQSEVKIIHIIVQDQDGQNNNIRAFISSAWCPKLHNCFAHHYYGHEEFRYDVN